MKNKRLKILLTNDDGYTSVGLIKLTERLAKDHDVYVVAPDSQRSAFSHAIVFHNKITFTRLDEYHGAKLAYISSGTPANCAKFALTNLGVQFDLLIAGPNNGENIAFDIPYSGTVGAAEEGAMLNVPSVALSRIHRGDNFENCIDFAVKNIDRFLQFKKNGVLLNVNVPEDDVEIKGVIVTHQGGALFADYYVKTEDGDYYLDGDLVDFDALPPCDAYYVEKGYVTLTPLKVDQTDYDSMKLVEKVFLP